MTKVGERDQQLKQIKDEVLALEGSALAERRREGGYWPVVGQGDHGAKLMLIGEAPGEEEARTGRPFVGKSGQMLDRLLKEVGLERGKIYITSLVKDRPPGNRQPKPEEIEVYSPLMVRQIEIIQPKVIGTLGRVAMEWVGKYFSQIKLGKISQIHGEKQLITVLGKPTWLMPLYHPAVVLYEPSKWQGLVDDMKQLRDLVNTD